MYYIYALIDPITNLPFYIGKGKEKRYENHLKKNTKCFETNKRKKEKILFLEKIGLQPKIKKLIENIKDENLAYTLEKEFIKKYGREGIDKKGILTNICTDSKPPNLKGKTYKEIYGENWETEIEKRRKTQKIRGGFGPKKHKEKTKQKIKEKTEKQKNPNYNGIDEEKLLEIGKNFVNFFDQKISNKKWIKFCEKEKISKNLRKSFRFNNRDFFEILVEKFNAKITKDKKNLQWIVNESTGKVKRIFDWEIEKFGLPHGFKRGRPKDHLTETHRKNRKKS